MSGVEAFEQRDEFRRLVGAAHLLAIKQRVLSSEMASARQIAERMRRTDEPAKLVSLFERLNA